MGTNTIMEGMTKEQLDLFYSLYDTAKTLVRNWPVNWPRGDQDYGISFPMVFKYPQNGSDQWEVRIRPLTTDRVKWPESIPFREDIEALMNEEPE